MSDKYSDFTIGFIQTYIYQPYQFQEDTKLNKYIPQDRPPNWIIGFIKVYK